MDWFKRAKQGLIPQKKKEIPDLWVKCESCGEIIYKRQLEQSSHVCTSCGFHFRIKAADYIKLLLDEGTFSEFHQEVMPIDFLKFKAKKKYADQLKEAAKRTNSADAVRTGYGNIHGRPVVFCAMDFAFIGGSMGSVVGEKIALAINKAIERQLPFIIVSASGGARMMEGALSLMQMAKTASRLALLSDAGLPYISVLTDPTTGGVTASFSMLGDVNLAEPGALIGFAGPRVIKQTIGEDLPEGFQRSEFLLQHGFLDAIVKRTEIKQAIDRILDILYPDELTSSEASNGSMNAVGLAETPVPAELDQDSKNN